jgi:hypothetical protein
MKGSTIGWKYNVQYNDKYMYIVGNTNGKCIYRHSVSINVKMNSVEYST